MRVKTFRLGVFFSIQGQLYLWSLDSAGVSREEAKLLELKVEAANGFPSQPTMLHGMDTDENDFTFSLGNFSKSSDN